jgi:hypothetical protein
MRITAVQRERSPDDVHRTAKPPLPVGIADDRDRAFGTAAAPVVLRREPAAQDRLNAEHVEKRAADPHTLDQLRLTRTRQVETLDGKGSQPSEPAAVLAELLPDGVGPGVELVLARLQYPEPLRIVNRERSEQQAVDDREHRGVRADAQGEGNDREGRHERRGMQGPPGVAHSLARSHGTLDGPSSLKVGYNLRSRPMSAGLRTDVRRSEDRRLHRWVAK